MLRTTSSPFSSSDEAEEGRVIGPEDFVKDEAEAAHALADALAQTAEEADCFAVRRRGLIGERERPRPGIEGRAWHLLR
jgi:hypothetical protein